MNFLGGELTNPCGETRAPSGEDTALGGQAETLRLIGCRGPERTMQRSAGSLEGRSESESWAP